MTKVPPTQVAAGETVLTDQKWQAANLSKRSIKSLVQSSLISASLLTSCFLLLGHMIRHRRLFEGVSFSQLRHFSAPPFLKNTFHCVVKN